MQLSLLALLPESMGKTRRIATNRSSAKICFLTIILICGFPLLNVTLIENSNASSEKDAEHTRQIRDNESENDDSNDDSSNDDSSDDSSEKNIRKSSSGECGKNKPSQNNREGKNDDGDNENDDGKNENSNDDSDENDDGENDDGESRGDESNNTDECDDDLNKPLGSAQIILDNTAGFNNIALYTNLATAASPTCTKSDTLNFQRCNSFSLGNNDIQVIQEDVSGQLTKMIGVDNEDSSSYENAGKDTQLDYFSPDKDLVQIIDDIREVSISITNLSSGLPAGTYGSISFKQFIQNVSLGRSMYGPIRVKVPLIKVSPNGNPPSRGDDGNDNENDDGDDGDDQNSSDDSDSDNRSSNNSRADRDDEDSDDSDNDDGDGRSNDKYQLCGEQPTAKCFLCGPGNNTKIEPGASVCDINLGPNAKINVFGSLMFDWIDCESKEPIAHTDLYSSGNKISFNISVPLNINPVNQDASQSTMKSISAISDIVGANTCLSGSPCNIPVDKPIPFNLVGDSTKKNYQYKTGNKLTNVEFNQLSRSMQFSLIMPSGYEKGWEIAFRELNISAEDWFNYGFRVPEDVSDLLTENDIRSESFQDIPAFIYSGGIVGIHHHANISGLVYIPQAFDLEQNGLLNGNTFTPSLQYFNGAIIVRDGFYLEAKFLGGVTIISNNPDTYSRVKLAPSSPRSGGFERFPEILPDTENDESKNPSNPGPPGSTPSKANGKKEKSLADQKYNERFKPGPQWMEIRPQ